MNPTRNGVDSFRCVSDPVQRYQTSFVGVESLTRQDQAEMVNINNIYRKTQQGQMTLVAGTPPTFGDFSDQGNYDVMLETIQAAQEAFMALPSDVRKEYGHDASLYYEKVTSQAAADAKAKAQVAADEEKAKAYKSKIEEAKSLLGSLNTDQKDS
ncbi:internal scaffolding protein [Microviridae sp.]|nr:internal scaffolding protein [Microviridae sp.]